MATEQSICRLVSHHIGVLAKQELRTEESPKKNRQPPRALLFTVSFFDVDARAPSLTSSTSTLCRFVVSVNTCWHSIHYSSSSPPKSTGNPVRADGVFTEIDSGSIHTTFRTLRWWTSEVNEMTWDFLILVIIIWIIMEANLKLNTYTYIWIFKGDLGWWRNSKKQSSGVYWKAKGKRVFSKNLSKKAWKTEELERAI